MSAPTKIIAKIWQKSFLPQRFQYSPASLSSTGIIKCDTFLAGSNLMLRLYGNFEGFAGKIVHCLGSCHTMTTLINGSETCRCNNKILIISAFTHLC